MKKTIKNILIAVLLVPQFLIAQTKLSSLFGNNMVLQQNDIVAIWGTDTNNILITVSGSWGN